MKYVEKYQQMINDICTVSDIDVANVVNNTRYPLTDKVVTSYMDVYKQLGDLPDGTQLKKLFIQNKISGGMFIKLHPDINLAELAEIRSKIFKCRDNLDTLSNVGVTLYALCYNKIYLDKSKKAYMLGNPELHVVNHNNFGDMINNWYRKYVNKNIHYCIKATGKMYHESILPKDAEVKFEKIINFIKMNCNFTIPSKVLKMMVEDEMVGVSRFDINKEALEAQLSNLLGTVRSFDEESHEQKMLEITGASIPVWSDSYDYVEDITYKIKNMMSIYIDIIAPRDLCKEAYRYVARARYPFFYNINGRAVNCTKRTVDEASSSWLDAAIKLFSNDHFSFRKGVINYEFVQYAEYMIEQLWDHQDTTYLDALSYNAPDLYDNLVYVFEPKYTKAIKEFKDNLKERCPFKYYGLLAKEKNSWKNTIKLTASILLRDLNYEGRLHGQEELPDDVYGFIGGIINGDPKPLFHSDNNLLTKDEDDQDILD